MHILKILLPMLLALTPRTGLAQQEEDDSMQLVSPGLAPLPSEERRAVVQVYAARTARWRRYFAVHSWIATKERGASSYTIYQVIGWRLMYWGRGVISEEEGQPDRPWFGHDAELLGDLRGPEAESAIPKIAQAVAAYPYPHDYRAWPGPNSNTFVSFILRSVPELGVTLPPTAIGKDWIGSGSLVGKSEAGTGFQVSLLGVLGFTLGLREGIEVNVLGFTFGVDFLRPALKLPLVGRLGFSGTRVIESEDARQKDIHTLPPIAVDKRREPTRSAN